MLDRKYNKVRIDKKLTLGKNASIVATSAAGVESALDVTEMAALNVTPGTATASKAVVLDASKGIATITSATITTLTAPTVNATNIDAGASGTAGSVDVFPSTGTKGKLAITCTDQTGDTTVSVVAGAMGAARTITLRDPGAAASFLTTTDATAAATTATAAEISAVVAGNTATAAEITRTCDASARIVNTTATTLSLTVTQHAERVVLLNASGTTNIFNLPSATGSGAKFTIVNNFPQTQGSIVVNAAGTEVMAGVAINVDASGASATKAFATTATDRKITMNRTTTGAVASFTGDTVEAWDSAAGVWTVRVNVLCSGSQATPFASS